MPDPQRWAVLKIPDFRVLLLSRLGTFMSLQALAVIIGWQVYQLKPDPLLLGLLGLTEAIPAIGFSFISGHLVDVQRPALICRLSLGVLLLNSVLPLIAVLPSQSLSIDTRIGLLFATVFVSGAARSFFQPAVFSLIPKVVPRTQLARAAAWSSSIYQIASIAGPAVGGLVYGFFGPVTAFVTPLLLQTFAFGAGHLLSPEASLMRSASTREPLAQSIRSGLKFAFGHRVLFSAMTLDMFSVLFGGAVAVLPIYADQILHVGSTGLGLLRAAPSIGSALVAVALAVRPMRVISGTTLLWAVTGFGAATLVFAVSTNFYVSLIFLGLGGAFDGVSMVIRQTILQLLTPDNMRGRVSSLNSIFITSSNEIGAFESGLAARLIGLVPSVVFGGAMTLVVVAVTAFVAPELRGTRIASGDDAS